MGYIQDYSSLLRIIGKILVITVIVLFLVVVFVFCLRLYAKWFWLQVIESPSPPPSTAPRRRRRGLVFVPPARQDTLRGGLDPSIVKSLPVVIFRSKDFEDGLECAVCLSEVVQEEKVRVLPICKHGFHVDCIDMWFHSNSTCPLCRCSVSTSSSFPPQSSITIPPLPQESPRIGNGLGRCLESQGTSSSSSSSLSAVVRQEEMVTIDVHDNSTEEESKLPTPRRLISLKRLMSWEKKGAPSTSSN